MNRPGPGTKRGDYFKPPIATILEKELFGKLIYYEEGDDEHQNAGKILCFTKPFQDKTLRFVSEAVNDLPFKNGEWNFHKGTIKDAPIVSFDVVSTSYRGPFLGTEGFFAVNVKRSEMSYEEADKYYKKKTENLNFKPYK